MSGTLGIPLAFVILGAILLWIVIGTKGLWWLKMFLIASCLLFSVAVWSSLDNYAGWPSQSTMPNSFIVYWIKVDEPSKTTGSPGAIYFWVREVIPADEEQNMFEWFHYVGNKNEPRTYVKPYSKELHKQAEKALAGIKKGVTIMGGKACKDCGKPGCKGSGKGCPGGDGNGKGKNGAFSFSRSDDPVLFPLPPPLIPEKLLPQAE